MAKALGLTITIGSAIAGAIGGIKSVLGETDKLGSAIEKLNAKKVKVFENIDKEFAKKLEPIEAKLQSFYGKEHNLKLRLSVIDAELKSLQKSLRVTKTKIRELESQKVDLRHLFEQGKISAQKFNEKIQHIDAELTKLRKTRLNLAEKIEKTSIKANHLQNALQSVKRKITKINQTKLTLKKDLDAAKQKAAETNKEIAKLGSAIEKLSKHKIQIQQAKLKREEFRTKLFDTVAIGATIAFPVKKAIEFESAMADVRKVANLTNEETKLFGNELLKLSTKMPIAASGLASIAASGAQLGIAKKRLVEFTNVVAKMSTAFDMSAEEAGQSVAKLKNVFGLTLSQVSRLGDALNHLSDNTAAKANDMVNVLARIGGTAKMFGLSAKSAAALADAFLAMGKAPETASTAINAFLNRLLTADKQGKKFQSALRTLGLNAYEIKFAIKDDPQKAIMMVLQKIKQLDKQTQMGILTDMFGTEFADDIALLVGGLDNYKKALTLVAKEQSYAGSMQKEFENRSKTTANQLQLLGNSLNQIGIALGSVVLPPLQTGAKYLAKLFNGVAKLNEEFPLFGKAISYAAVGLGGFVVTSATLGYAMSFVVGGLARAKIATVLLSEAISFATIKTKALSLWSSVLKAKAFGAATANMAWSLSSRALGASLGFLGGSLKAVGRSVLWLGRAMLFNPIGLAITAIAGGAYLIYRYWEPIKSFFSNLWSGVKSIFSKGTSYLKKALSFSPIGLVFGAFAPVSKFFGSFWSGVAGMFRKGVGYIANLFLHPVQTIKKTFTSLFDWLAKKLGWVGSALKKVFGFGAKIGSAIKGFFGGDEEQKPKVGSAIKKVVAVGASATTLAVAQPQLPKVPKFDVHPSIPQTVVKPNNQKIAAIEPSLQRAQKIVTPKIKPIVEPQVAKKVAIAKPTITPIVNQPKPILPQIVKPEPIIPKIVAPKPVTISTVAQKVAKPKPIAPQIIPPKPITPIVNQPAAITPELELPKPIIPQVLQPKPIIPTVANLPAIEPKIIQSKPIVPTLAKMPVVEPIVKAPEPIIPRVQNIPTIEPKLREPRPILPKVLLPRPIVPQIANLKPIVPEIIAPKPIAPQIQIPKAIMPHIAPKVLEPRPIIPKVIEPKPILAKMQSLSMPTPLLSQISVPVPKLTEVPQKAAEIPAPVNTQTSQKSQNITVTLNFGDNVVQQDENIKEHIKEQIQSAIDEIDFNRFQGDLYDVV